MREGNDARLRAGLGFGLVDLMIVLFVLAVLAAIAIPDFLKGCGRPSKQSEAKTNLGAIFTTQVAYYSEYQTYASGPDCFELLGWAPEGDTIYTYWCDQDMIGPTRPDASPAACTVVKAQSSATAFTVCAAGNVDKDGFIDEWVMPDSKDLSNTANDVGN